MKNYGVTASLIMALLWLMGIYGVDPESFKYSRAIINSSVWSAAGLIIVCTSK